MSPLVKLGAKCAHVKDLEIDSATFSGVQIEGPFALSGAIFSNIRSSSPGTSGIYLANASGAATFSAVTASDPADQGSENTSGTSFKITRETGNSGW